ncbi:MAG TPA: diacylglycerol kinase family protein [Gemmatimonadaceae bacterium]|nr:diacylglycerol kinase family protein [Gemmatimonadaceae bacterium]
MRATLIHNPGAGEGQWPADDLLAPLRAAGYEPGYCSSKDPAFAEALADPGELVIAAGGDGTVAQVATRLERRDVPLAILPLGTANNIARTLGIADEPLAVIAGLRDAERRRLDVGIARAPWGESRFVEAVGLGLFARLLAVADGADDAPGKHAPADDQLAHGLRALLRLLHEHRAHARRITADGAELSGRYLLVAAMSIRSIGPRLMLAPDADPGDGALDLVLVADDDRAALAEYLTRRLAGDTPRFGIPARRVRRLRLEWDPSEGHVDDERWPGKRRDQPDTPPMVDVTLTGAPIEVLVPRG